MVLLNLLSLSIPGDQIYFFASSPVEQTGPKSCFWLLYLSKANKVRRKVMEGTKIKQKKMDQDVAEKHDCLSKLPEHLLHHILSYLTMKDVIRTSVLAKRWQYTWLYVPCLTSSPLKKTRSSKDGAFINKSLLVHKGSKFQKLNITFKYGHTDAPLVDSWIQFSFTRNVSQFYRDFSRCNSRTSKYTLHDTIFRCSLLAVLTVKSCIIKFPVKIKLDSLKTLSFEEVNFDGGDVNNLLSSYSTLDVNNLLSSFI